MIDELSLACGVPYEIEGLGKVYPLKLKEIAGIKENKYNGLLGILCFDLDEMLKDVPEDKKRDITAFKIVLGNYVRDEGFRKSFAEAIRLFLREDIAIREDGCFQIGILGDNRVLNSDNFDVLREVIMAQNGIEKKKRDMPEAGNSLADEFMKQMEAIKNKYKKFAEKKNQIMLSELVNAVAWKGGIGINEVSEMTIYQLYAALKQLQLIDMYENTMLGIYTGNVDSTKVKDLNWIKEKEG